MNGNMIDYKWRTYLDLPEFQTLINETPISSHRFKAVGVGEIVELASELPDRWDVLLVSDFLYEPANRDRLIELAREDRTVLVSDPERPASPRFPDEPLCRVSACTVPDVDSPMRTAAIFRL